MKRHRVFHLFILIFFTHAEHIFEFTAPLYNLSLEENSVGAKYARTDNSTKIGVVLPEKDAICKFRVAEIVGEKSSLFKAHARQVGDFVFLRIRYKGDNPLNRELKDFYDILVKATCKRRDSSNLETTARVHLRVIDRNDASPVFLVDEQGYEAQIDDDLAPFSPVLQVEASDADIGLNSAIYYSLLEKSHDFFVEPVTGWIRTLRHVKPGEYRLKVKSEDRASRLYYFDENEVQASWTADVLIKVNEKKTQKTLARVETRKIRMNTENKQLAAIVTLENASDGVRMGVQDARFFVESENEQWKVYTAARISEDKTNVTLIIGDDYLRANRRKMSNTTVEFQLEATLENSLMFDSSEVLSFKTDELAPIGRFIGKIQASSESSEAIRYSVKSANSSLPFSVDSKSGILTVSSRIQQRTIYNFEVVATQNTVNISQKVSVEIVDGNDHSPVFAAKWMRQGPVAIAENQPTDQALLKIDAVDQDEGDNGKVVYKLSGENTPLQIDAMSGEISLASSIKGLKTSSWPVTVWAIDWGVPMSRMAALNLVFYKNGTKVPQKPKPVIVPEAGNQHDPQFTSFPELVEVTEDAPIGTVVAKLAAVDQDTGYAALIRYTVDRPHLLAVDEQTGRVTVAGPLSGVLREKAESGEVEVKVTASDAGEPVRSTTKTIRVKVLDVNDHEPRFEQQSYTIRIPENEKPGKQLLKVTATDFDGGNNGKVGYFLAHDSDAEDSIFSIDQTSGIITLRKPVDLESQDSHTFTLLAIDSGIPAKSALANLTIHLEDVNDNAPRCVNAVTRLRIAEDLPNGAFVGCLAASDADSGENARLKYTLNTEAVPFRVDHHSGCVFVHAPRDPLDFHVIPMYNLTVEVADHGTPMLSTECRVEVALVDVAHTHLAIEFDDVAKEASVYENSDIGTEVIMIEAKEMADERRKAQNVRYSIVGGDGWPVFSIDEKGTVRTTALLDREVKSAYWITVEARDALKTSSARRRAVLHVFIRILDRNDHRPMAKKPMYTASVPENSPANVVIVKVEASDADDVDNDAASPLTFKIERGDPQSFFRIDVTSGYITTSGVRRLDREKQAEHELWVAVCDGGEPQLCSNVVVIVTVSDENDNAPAFTQPIHHYNVRAGHVGTLCRIFAVDADDGDNARLFYNITEGDSRFSIDENGNIAASAPIHGDESYALTVQATDNGSPSQFTATRVVLTAMGSSKKTSQKKKNTPPVISGKKSDYVIPISDADQVGLTVGKLEAIDADGDELWWNISGGDELAVFDVRRDSGQLLLAKKVELLKRGEMRLNVSVTDGIDSDHTIVIIQASRQISQRPRFSASHYQTDISERTAVGTQIYTLKASGESTATKPLVFSLFSVDDVAMDDRIRVEPSSGNVIVMEPMDYEASRRVQAVVQVQQAALKSFATFIVNVNDENDNAPRFVHKSVETAIGSVGDVVAKVTAFDKDHGDVVYSIVGGNELGTFGIDEKSGDVTIRKPIDPENHVESILRIRASDGELKDEMDLHVRNSEGSEQSAVRFARRVYQTSVEDSTRPGTPILVLDVVNHGSVNFRLVDCPEFEVHALSGAVHLATWLTRNRTAKFVECTALVESDGKESGDEARIVARVIRTNQHAPVFRQEVYRGSVRENSADDALVLTAGHLPLVLSALDGDSGANGLVGYRILTEQDRFSIDKFSGAIRVKKPLDFEERSKYSFRVQAFDMGQPSRQSPLPALVVVSIIDENDNPPRFPEKTVEATVTLPTADGVLVGGQTAEDRDTVGVLRYYIKKAHSAFSIDSRTSEVRVRRAAELKEKMYELEVFVSDGRTSSSYRMKITAKKIADDGFRFARKEYQAVVRENTTLLPGAVVASVSTIGTSQQVTYSIVNPRSEFYIHPGTGIVAATGLMIDRETTPVVLLVIQAKTARHVAQTILKIDVEDVNDNAPIFMGTPYEVTVASNSDVGTKVFKLLATDSDAGDFGKVQFSSEDLPELFTLNSDEIVTTRALETGDYTFTVIAKDSGAPPLVSKTSVLIRVVDKERPVFEQNLYVADVSRSTRKSTVLVKVTAKSVGAVGYRIIGTDKFTVDFETGEVRILRDPRGFESANFEVEARELTRPQLTARTKIRIGFKEDVVKTPHFEQNRYVASIPETASIGQHILQVKVEKNDEDVEYSISNDTYFTIQKETGEIRLAKPLDFEKTQKYELKVFAEVKDQKSGSADVVVEVLDVNDERPKFLESDVVARLDDSAAPGQFVTIMSATDPDTISSLPSGQKLMWRIVAGDETLFDVADSTGQISLARRVEPEDVIGGRVLNVSVTDGVFIEYARLTVEVTRNGATRPPPRFEQSHYVASALENTIVNKSALLTVGAKDGIRPLRYSLGPASSSSWPVSIDRKTGRIHVSRVLNYHNDKRYQIPLVVEDAARRRAFSTLTLSVIDINDKPPVFVLPFYTTSISEAARAGDTVLMVSATDDDENDSIEYSLPDNGSGADLFHVHPRQGTITVAKQLEHKAGVTLSLIVKATDAANPPHHATTTVEINVASEAVKVPRFSNSHYLFAVQEDAAVGNVIGSVQQMEEEIDEVRFSVADQSVPFGVERASGKIIVKAALDRERRKKWKFTVRADAAGGVHAMTTVTVDVGDVNDNAPAFHGDYERLTIAEDAAIGTSVTIFSAMDRDEAPSGRIRFSLVDDSPDFAVDETSGWLTVTRRLDREKTSVYRLTARATDEGGFNTDLPFSIAIQDVNDSPPRFDKEEYLVDGLPKNGGPLVRFLVSDDDLPPNNASKLVILDGNEEGIFSIDKSHQLILDRPEIVGKEHHLTIVAFDGVFEATAKVIVKIPPVPIVVCPEPKTSANVTENAKKGTLVLGEPKQKISDVTFEIAEDTPFVVNFRNGIVKIKEPIDFETHEILEFTRRMVSTTTKEVVCAEKVTVFVANENDNPPEISESQIDVDLKENLPTSEDSRHLVHRIRASDADGDVLKYSLMDSFDDTFRIDEDGVVTVVKPLDSEAVDRYELIVVVSDGKFEKRAKIHVTVIDQNDNAPVFEKSTYSMKVMESETPGYELARFRASGGDANETISFSLKPSDLTRFVRLSDDGVLTLAAPLDFETIQTIELIVVATDSGVPALSSEAKVEILVMDENDNAPVFEKTKYAGKVRENSKSGTSVLKVKATDADKEHFGSVSYSLQSNLSDLPFSINDQGEITVSGSIDFETTKKFTFRVVAQDGGKLRSEALVEVQVTDENDHAPTFADCNMSAVVQEDDPIGHTLLTFAITDLDGPENSSPFDVVLSGDGATSFRVTDDLRLVTARKLKHSAKKDKYLLTVAAKDRKGKSADCPLTVYIRQASRHAPQMKSMRIRVNTLQNEMAAGVIGRLRAVDEDAEDVLRFGIVDDSTRGPLPTLDTPMPSGRPHIFKIDTNSGEIWAEHSLPQGLHAFNVTVSDGKFTTVSFVEVHVSSIDSDVLDHAVAIRVRDMTVEEFMREHVSRFRKTIAVHLNLNEESVQLISVQPAVSDEKRTRRRASSGDLDVLMTAQRGIGIGRGYLKPDHVYSRLKVDFQNLNNQSERMRYQLITEMCTTGVCLRGECREVIELMEDEWTRVSTADYSFVSPYHSRSAQCLCPDGFGGKRCETATNRCSKSPCERWQICIPSVRNDTFECTCPLGMHGDRCQVPSCSNDGKCLEEAELSVGGDGYFEMSLSNAVEQRMELEIEIKTTTNNGVLMHTAGRHDFHSLLLVNGSVEYHWNAGSGVGTVRSRRQIADGQWHRVTVSRRQRRTRMTIDDDDLQEAFSPSGSTVLNLHSNAQRLVIGARLSADGSVTDGVAACFRTVSVDGMRVPKTRQGMKLFGAQPGCTALTSSPCNEMPCQHAGTCVAHGKSFVCECPSRYSGDRCEIDLEPCGSHPCPPSIQCIPFYNDYLCKCPDGFTGKHCESRNLQEVHSSCSRPEVCGSTGHCISIPRQNPQSSDFICNCTGGVLQSAPCSERGGVSVLEWLVRAEVVMILVGAAFLLLVVCLTCVVWKCCRRTRDPKYGAHCDVPHMRNTRVLMPSVPPPPLPPRGFRSDTTTTTNHRPMVSVKPFSNVPIRESRSPSVCGSSSRPSDKFRARMSELTALRNSNEDWMESIDDRLGSVYSRAAAGALIVGDTELRPVVNDDDYMTMKPRKDVNFEKDSPAEEEEQKPAIPAHKSVVYDDPMNSASFDDIDEEVDIHLS